MNCHEKSKFQQLEKLVNGEDVVWGGEVSFFWLLGCEEGASLFFKL